MHSSAYTHYPTQHNVFYSKAAEQTKLHLENRLTLINHHPNLTKSFEHSNPKQITVSTRHMPVSFNAPTSNGRILIVKMPLHSSITNQACHPYTYHKSKVCKEHQSLINSINIKYFSLLLHYKDLLNSPTLQRMRTTAAVNNSLTDQNKFFSLFMLEQIKIVRWAIFKKKIINLE